jgi:hypothetical protein
MLGIALVYLFGGIWIPGLDLFPRPGSSWTPFLVSPLEWAHGLILPWITLAFISSATYVRLSRSSMREVLGEDYITSARARGLSERRVVYRHALHAAIAPIMTQFGIDLATLLGGAIITEMVFNLPGVRKGDRRSCAQPGPPCRARCRPRRLGIHRGGQHRRGWALWRHRSQGQGLLSLSACCAHRPPFAPRRVRPGGVNRFDLTAERRCSGHMTGANVALVVGLQSLRLVDVVDHHRM